MTDKTTIEITTEQRDELISRRLHDREPYYVTLDRVLDDTDGPGALDDDLAAQLDRIEAATKEATNAAQNAERAAEALQR